MEPPLSECQPSYALEEANNFRWMPKFVAGSQHALRSGDLTSLDLQLELSEIGQFAEVANGFLSPDLIWQNTDRFLQPRFPLADYNALRGSTLVSSFRGTVANLQGYIAHRSSELIIAFSGTCNIQQAVHSLDVRRVKHPAGDGSAVHAGFWKIYGGVRDYAFTALANALCEHDVHRIIFTGHSLGAVMCYLMALDVVERCRVGGASSVLPSSCRALMIAVFGCPRAGNLALVRRWRQVIADHTLAIQEYSVKGYNDGVPSLPPQFLGFHHFAQAPLYLDKGCLYHVPPSEFEAAFFNVIVDTPEQEQRQLQFLHHPHGGHNYYNGRDMERVLRTMRLLLSTGSGEPDWDGYLVRLRASEARIKNKK